MYPAPPASGVSLREIAQRVDGELRGNPDLRVMAMCALSEPQPRSLSFVSDNSKRSLLTTINTSTVDALLAPQAARELDIPDKNIIIVQDPLASMVELIPLFFRALNRTSGIHATAIIDPSATIDPTAEIGAYCVIGAHAVIRSGARLLTHVVVYEGGLIGAGALLHSGVIVRERCEIGAGCIIQNGAIIGSDGFGYFLKPGQGLVPVPQVGTVKLAAQVDIGANACVDRATFGTTLINTGSKVDNLVQIGHNVTIGQHSIVCGQTGIAGSCKIGNGVTIGGAVGVSDHLTIVDGVRVGGGSVVISDLLAKGDYMGYPATPSIKWRRQQVTMARLPELLKKFGSQGLVGIKKTTPAQDASIENIDRKVR